MPDPGPADFRSSLARARGRSPFFRLLAAIGSAPMAALLIALVVVVTWSATYYEAAYGREAAAALVYQSLWFNALFVGLALAVVCAVVVRWPWQRHQRGFVVVHAGLLTLILGFALAGRDRLDGMLQAPPGREVDQIELPVDYVAMVVQPAGAASAATTQAHAVHLQTYDLAGYPSFPRFLLAPLWPYQRPGIHRLDRPAPVLALPEAGLALAVTAVADTAALQPGRGAATPGEPAVRVALRLRTPGQAADQALDGRWLTADADGGQLFVGPLATTFACARDAALAEAFAHPPAQVPAAGRLRVVWHGRVHDLDIDAGHLPQVLVLDTLTVTVEERIERPRQREGRLVEDAGAEANPVLRLRLAEGGRTTSAWVAAGALLPSLPGDWPELLYEHPLWLAGAGAGQGQGGVAMLLGAPDGRLLVRTATRSRGAGTAATVAAGDAWSGDVVGGEGMPMRVALDLLWLPSSQPGPEPLDVDPARKDRAERWVEFSLRGAGGERRLWLPRGGRETIELGGSQVVVHYDRARLDLRHSHGFAIRLEHFDEGRDPGGMRSASYASEVTVLRAGGGEERARISMNQPLHVGGATLYQTAFSPEIGPDGMPTGRQTSVFTVAEDRGRWLKYAGSALIVLGMLLLWWWRPRRPAPAAAPEAAP